MRQLRTPNGTNDFIPECEYCGGQIEPRFTGQGLNRWYHIENNNRWCLEKAENGDSRKMASYKGSIIPYGRFHKLPELVDPADATEEVLADLAELLDNVEDLRHRLRNPNAS